MTNAKKPEKTLILQIFSILFLILCLIGTVYFVRARKYNTFSSDEASEMVLGSLLASEGKLITENWYYSTELRVLNTNIFYALFFHLTGSWHRVRMLATVSMYLLLLLSWFGLSRACGFRKYFALTGAVLFLPFSEVYFNIVLKGAYYLPHLTISILVLMLSELYAGSRGRKAIGLLILSFVFSVIVGLGGARQILVLYIPLAAASLILFLIRREDDASRRWFIFAAAAFIGGMTGYIINMKVLSWIYHFETWNDFAFTELNFERIAMVVRGFLRSFGYSEGKVFSDALLRNAISLIWALFTVSAVVYALKRRDDVSGAYLRLSLFMASAFTVFCVFFAFTNTSYTERFDLPILIFSLPLAVMFADHTGPAKRILVTCFTILVAMTAVSGQMFYARMWDHDPNRELKQIAADLTSQDYRNGYASFWNANVVTELSDGRIEMWSITEGINGQAFMRVTDIDQTYHWLQKVSHDTTHPSGKLFILFTAKEAEYNNWKDHLKDDRIIYRSDAYVIYGYENYEEMINELYPGYDFAFGDDQWVENGKDTDGHRELYVGGKSYGPYETFWPGTYDVIIKGRGLEDAQAFCIAGFGEKHIPLTQVEQDGQSLRCSFELDEKTRNTELIVRNMSDEPGTVVRLDSLSIRKRKDR